MSINNIIASSLLHHHNNIYIYGTRFRSHPFQALLQERFVQIKRLVLLCYCVQLFGTIITINPFREVSIILLLLHYSIIIKILWSPILFTCHHGVGMPFLFVPFTFSFVAATAATVTSLLGLFFISGSRICL